MSSDNPKNRPRGTEYQAHIMFADQALDQLANELADYCAETEALIFTMLQSELDWLSKNGSQNPSAITDPGPLAGY